jgi:hypothetical protein
MPFLCALGASAVNILQFSRLTSDVATSLFINTLA